MDGRQALDRRCFLWHGLGLGAPLLVSARKKEKAVYHLTAAGCDIRMSVEFYDRYASDGFWFDERGSGRRYCLSADGGEGRNCLAQFAGSIAIARYRIRSDSHSPGLVRLREYVRTIDRDNRVKRRPPFERTLEFQGGLASDIQAFGYEPIAGSPKQLGMEHAPEPWCLFRQDLYLDGAGESFLVIHWKHALSAIRILDLIPGSQTRMLDQRAREDLR